MSALRLSVGSMSAVSLGWGLALASPSTTATERLPDPPIYTAPHVSEPVAHGVAHSEPHDSAGTSPLQRPFAERVSGVTLMELPREGMPGTGYQRPHHALGFRSSAAESWLHEHGIDAGSCYLPLVRLHTKLSNAGTASGSLWIYARCALR